VRAELGARRAEVLGQHPGVEQLDDWAERHAPGRLVLVDGRATRDGVVHHLLEGAAAHHPDLQRPDGVAVPELPVHGVERLLHLQAAALEHGRLGHPPPRALPHHQLPVHHVVPRDGGGVRLARVLHDAGAVRRQKRRRALHGRLQLRLVRLVRVDAQEHVLAAHEPELRRRVVEPGHLQDVADAVAAEPRVGGDHQLVLLPHLGVRQVHQPRRRAVVPAGRRLAGRRVVRQQLEVAHVGHDGVGHLRRVAHGPEVQPEVALGGGVHGARHGQPAAVVPQRRDVLRHGARHDHVQVLGVGPHPGDDALPAVLGALDLHEVGEAPVRREHLGDGRPDGRLGDPGAEGARPDVVRELLPVELQEADGAEQAGGEDGADAEHLGAGEQAAQHLRVHGLERVGAEDGGGGARVHVVGVVRAVLEVVALVVAGQHRARRQPAGRLRLRLYEQEVEALPLVKPRHVPDGRCKSSMHAAPRLIIFVFSYIFQKQIKKTHEIIIAVAPSFFSSQGMHVAV
jgi:hypothetical protein